MNDVHVDVSKSHTRGSWLRKRDISCSAHVVEFFSCFFRAALKAAISNKDKTFGTQPHVHRIVWCSLCTVIGGVSELVVIVPVVLYSWAMELVGVKGSTRLSLSHAFVLSAIWIEINYTYCRIWVVTLPTVPGVCVKIERAQNEVLVLLKCAINVHNVNRVLSHTRI